MHPQLQEFSSAEGKPLEELVSKQNTKVFIWKYFGFMPDGNGQPCGNPKCRLCGTEVLAKDI